LDGECLARLIDAEGVTMALGVPTIWQGLLAALKKRGSKAETLKRTIVGGSACPPSMIAEFRDKYGTEVVHAWGMTETSPLGTANALLERHGKLSEAEQAKIRESQGRPPYGVELKIVDDEGNRLPEDGVAQGNLRIRGHWVVADYFGFEAGETLEEDGWFETGDVASINAEGFMTIRDRSKDIIKSGGEWISTVELEGIAVGHPGVADAAAIAARHEKWDERPILLAVKAPGADVTEEELIAYYADKVAKWQIPDKVIFVDQLPRNATGKVLKNKLREEYGGVLTGA
jgi:fatty-acyl-CoA synthase